MSSSTARKVIGSLGVVGVAAAVAGMGTFGSFTDSTTPIAATIESGTVSINLTEASTATFAATGMVPGDSVTRLFTLKNDGNTALSTITADSEATKTSILTTDEDNGLQLTVKTCPTPYVQNGNAVSCAADERSLLNGPAVNGASLLRLASLNPGGSDNLAVTYSLPDSAGNAFQGKEAAFTLTFTATQRPAGAL